METNESRIRYLEAIQRVIDRLSNTSFILKGWAVSLVAGLMALAANGSNGDYVLIAYTGHRPPHAHSRRRGSHRGVGEWPRGPTGLSRAADGGRRALSPDGGTAKREFPVEAEINPISIPLPRHSDGYTEGSSCLALAFHKSLRKMQLDKCVEP